jgi:signal transduction histidine kinase/CheY-like chemotaxis protein
LFTATKQVFRHELRSPLHGVLAAAELLQGTKFDDFQGSLLETINACGRTLLDTMNQVLDYTKLVSLQKDLRHLKRNLASQVDIKSMQRSAGHLDAYMATDISLLSEEVVEGICLGHSYGQRPTVSIDATGAPLVTSKPSQDPNIPQLHVDVTMDIAQHDWIYFTPPGAIRRIIMNIFSNAVKYTESGRVSMTLEAKETSEIWSAQQGPKEDLITLTVSDTGRGMSAEFLQSKLFVPFAQENSLSVGTGLGLSIVRSLVKSLNGSINVESHSGEGTTVKVTLPLSRQRQEDHGSIPGALPSPPQEDSDFSTNEVHLLRSTRAGQKVAILGIEPSDARKHLLWGTISHYLVDWYGLELVSPSSESPIDVILTNEQRPKEVDNWGSTDPNQAVLVVSDKYTGHDAIREEWSPFTKVVSIISRPCGPHKLARFLQKCFNRDSSSSNPESMVSPEPEQNPLSMTVENTSSTEQTSLVNDIQTSNTNNGAPIPHNTAVQSSTEKVDSLPPPATTHNTEDRPEPRKPRVLVVEDNKINLHLMLSFLKKRELVTLDSAENGQLAVKAVESLQQGYDIIFMGKHFVPFPI